MTSAIQETRNLNRRCRHRALENYLQGAPSTQYFYTPQSRSRCSWTRVIITEDVEYRMEDGDPIREETGDHDASTAPVPFRGW